jgi:uncharacterized SAM-binding protein YcdF (DUF218 family)
VRRALLVIAALPVAWLAACGFLFLWPHEDELARADAVVVLAGDAENRIPRGLELVREGVADELVLSRDRGRLWSRWRRLCDAPSVVCFEAETYSTAGEAEALASLAERRGWRSITVVTSRYHVLRARMLFQRCFPYRVAAVGADYDRRWLPLILPLETAKLVRAWTTDRRCERAGETES